MKKTLNLVDELIEEVLAEQEWNKDSETPRDYSKEYNPPGSKEQEERNKRKRDKRKHDKEFGECPDNQDLHHVDGIENYKMKCEPPYINRGRKEKSRLKKGEIVIKIKEHEVRKIVQEETEEVLSEIFPALAGLAMRGGAMLGRAAPALGKAAWKGAGKVAKKGVQMAKKKVSKEVEKKMMDKAIKGIEQGAKEETTPVDQAMSDKMAGTTVGSFDQLSKMIDQVLMQASDENLTGDPSELIQKIKDSLPMLDKLKTAQSDTEASSAEQAKPLPTGGPIPWTPPTAAEKAQEPADKVSGAAEKATPAKPEEKEEEEADIVGVDAEGKPVRRKSKKEIEAEFAASPFGQALAKKKADFVKQFGFSLEESQESAVNEIYDLMVKSSK